MKIISSSYSNIAQLYQHKSISKPGYSSVCFKSRDLLDLPERDVFNKIKESIVPDNFLGQGTEAEVYRIKDTGYCVRIPYLAQDVYQLNYTKELSPIDKVNHVVAKLGAGASIMKYFEGTIPKWYQNNNYNRYKLQSVIANMPVKSYSELLHQLANAIDNEMLFDYSGGNIVVSAEKNKLTAIDFYGITDNPKPIRPLSEIYQVLTCYGSEKKTGKKIFDKIVSASIEEFKPNVIPCMDLELFDFEHLCLKRCHDGSTNDYNNLVKEIYQQTKILKELKKKEITDKSVTAILEQNIKKAVSLMSKIR